MMIKEIVEVNEKPKIARMILEALPDWFGIKESREEYIENSAGEIMIASFACDTPNGFLCLKQTGAQTVEIAVMGVLKEYHRSGIGRALFSKAKEIAIAKGYDFMQVKTVKMGVYDDYDKTNLFYRSLGFKEFEVFPDFWNADNPCQVYVMSLQ